MSANYSFAEGLSPESRVWVYQSNRDFTANELEGLDNAIVAFTRQWTAHNNQLKAAGTVLFNRFIILSVDESHNNASGCSIDKSVHFVQQVEQQYNVNLFDRLTLAFKEGGNVLTFPLSELNQNFSAGKINEQTLFFNNTVLTLADLQSKWLIPVADSWLAARLKKEKV